jgi:Tfp pilus assembly protein FimT
MNVQRGMTFFEVLVVMGIFVLVGGFALFVSMESYHGSSFRSDRNLLVAALQRARAQAMNNICLGAGCTDGKSHGVHIDPDAYIVFQDNGSGYISTDPLNAKFDASEAVVHSGYLASPLHNNVVFTQLSGNTSCGTPCDISLTQGGQTSTSTVTSEGRISWSN